jgi:hypothetical protein
MEKKAFEPGELINGQVAWKEICQGIALDIRLIWYTLGKGSRDHSVVASTPIAQPSERGEKSFSFIAPQWPHSFVGEMLSLQWAIEVVELPSEEATEVEIIIAPGSKEIELPREPQPPKRFWQPLSS